jgi:hypothetical protein
MWSKTFDILEVAKLGCLFMMPSSYNLTRSALPCKHARDDSRLNPLPKRYNLHPQGGLECKKRKESVKIEEMCTLSKEILTLHYATLQASCQLSPIGHGTCHGCRSSD